MDGNFVDLGKSGYIGVRNAVGVPRIKAYSSYFHISTSVQNVSVYTLSLQREYLMVLRLLSHIP